MANVERVTTILSTVKDANTRADILINVANLDTDHGVVDSAQSLGQQNFSRT